MKAAIHMQYDMLFKEYKLNQILTLKNRILMAPMTRSKATDDLLPTEQMAEYYARRADAGLIVTEGTIIRPDGKGFNNIAGIYNNAQINKWRAVTDAVHHRDGLIFSQIWHVGRVSHPRFLNGELPISCSETEMTGRIPRSNDLTFGKSRAATLSEIKALIESYAAAAANAIKAGFDGVEIHGANGYLIDQFLHYHTNHREDDYGGSVENRARFALEVVKACGDTIGYERVGLRLSPGAYLHEIVGDMRDAEVFKYLLKQIFLLRIAYVHVGNFDDTRQFPELSNLTMSDFMRENYKGTVIACGGYTVEKAVQAISKKAFDLVALGRPFIANPDLIERIKSGQELQLYDASMLSKLY